MKNSILLKANVKRHKITMISIFTIMMMVSLTLVSVLTIWMNTNSYVSSEMDRLHYGDITAWTREIPDLDQMYENINGLQEVEDVFTQQLIYANYKINDTRSDSEGQLIVYDPQTFAYHIFDETMHGYETETVHMETGEIYISPSLLSTFDIHIGDEINFEIGRGGNEKSFIVKGMYEDPFMGSSMIGMKGFLITQDDYDEVIERIDSAGVDALASAGQMQHIQQSEESSLQYTQFHQVLNTETNLDEYTEFVYSKSAIAGFMSILQNAFTGLFLSFALTLLLISIIITGYSIGAVIDQDHKNMAILKTVGYDGTMIRRNMKIQYLSVIMVALIVGLLMSLFTIPLLCDAMLSFAGIRTPESPRLFLWLFILSIILLIFYGFIHMKTRKIEAIPPVIGMQEDVISKNASGKKYVSLKRNYLPLSISLRQLLSGKQRYLSIGITAVLLVFFVSMIGRMNIWLGSDGEGMMDAFNPADLDIGVQLLGQHNEDDMQAQIQAYTEITDSYALAMLGVVVEDVDYTANIITETNRFHIQQGTTIQSANEIVITETIAKDRGLQISDELTVSYNGQSAIYRIVGIYQCANEMGANVGMSREGFQRIGTITSDLWCHHYFLEDESQKQEVMDRLDAVYGGDVHVHENTWPGLRSIITAMQMLLMFMYVVSTAYILIVTILSGNKIFLSEKRNLAMYQTLGFTARQLRFTFAIRYGIVAGIGSLSGIALSSLFTDRLVGTFMRLYGISNFASHPGILSIILPGVFVSILFMLSAYQISKKMKYLDINELIDE